MKTEESGRHGLRAKLIEEIPNRLERARKTSGFDSLRELHRALTAEGAGYSVSYPSVLNYHGKSEEREPPISYLIRFSEITGVRLEWLVTGDGDMVPDSAETEGTAAGAPMNAFAARITEGLERARQRDPERFDRTVGRVLLLPGRFADRLPFKSELNPAAQAALKELATQLVSASATEDEEGLWTDDMDRFADDVGKLMRFPYEKFGLREDPSSFRYNQYVMGLVQALMLVAPKREEDVEVRSYPIKSEVPT